MGNLVVGVDLSPASEGAIAHAIGIARHLGWDAALVLVEAASTPQDWLEDDRRRLIALRERWSGQGVELSQLVVEGDADERLPAIATETDAALIVVGSQGRTGLERFLIGSVAERVARNAGVDVLITRGAAPDGGYHRAVIGTDFTAEAERAARHALRYLARGARVELVHCWWMPGARTFAEPVVGLTRDELHTDLERQLRAAGDRLRGALAERPDLVLVHDLVPSSPARGLAELAATRDADLIVVGSHGRRGLRRLVLGSVAEVTARHAPCSVLVAR